jgi:hypothetical protein
MDKLFLSMYLMVQSMMSFHTDAPLPKFTPVEKKWIQETYCEGKDCNLAGLYAGGDTIYYVNSLDVEENALHASIIVHELVHYVQMQRDQYVLTTIPCPQYMSLEREAYGVQFKYLNILGIDTPTISPASFKCD